MWVKQRKIQFQKEAGFSVQEAGGGSVRGRAAPGGGRAPAGGGEGARGHPPVHALQGRSARWVPGGAGTRRRPGPHSATGGCGRRTRAGRVLRPGASPPAPSPSLRAESARRRRGDGAERPGKLQGASGAGVGRRIREGEGGGWCRGRLRRRSSPPRTRPALPDPGPRPGPRTQRQPPPARPRQAPRAPALLGSITD